MPIRHLTRYRYRNQVAPGEHRMMFRPPERYGQRVLSHAWFGERADYLGMDVEVDVESDEDMMLSRAPEVRAQPLAHGGVALAG